MTGVRSTTEETAIEQQLNLLRDQLQQSAQRLDGFYSASQQLFSLLAHNHNERVLAQRGIEVLTNLVEARYGAVALFDGSGKLGHFLHTGLTPEQVQLIGDSPQGKGLLAVVCHQQKLLHFNNMADDPRSIGFPLHHPNMTSLLAAPIVDADICVGSVFLCDKKDGIAFDSRDEQFVVTFANTLALVLRNVQDRAKQQCIEEKLQLAAKVIENTLEGVVLTDANFMILSINPGFTAMTGYEDHQVIGTPLEKLYAEKNRVNLKQEIITTLSSKGHWQGEIWGKRKNCASYPTRAAFSTIKDVDENVTRYVVVCSDITESKQTEERLHHLAHHDLLTDLPNRFLFDERLCQALDKARNDQSTVALMYIDLDRFKSVNDTLGHAVGDSLLRIVAQRITSCIRDEDTIARLSGDEFAIILVDLQEKLEAVKSAGRIANQILSSLAAPFHLEGGECFITASIGIALFPDNAIIASELLKRADMAMYISKEFGKNNCQFYTSNMGNAVRQRQALESSLRQALQRNEFVLEYQPQINIDSGEVSGLEALLRWRHPEKGLLMPSDFIPQAENTDLIVEIGEWVLLQVCRQIRLWQAELPAFGTLRVAVNLSMRQLSDHQLVANMEEIISATGVDPLHLEVEITESSFAHNVAKVEATILALKALGIKITIDDFGTSYSSLGYLKRFSVDALKIDRSFVKDVHSSADAGAITGAIISMSRSLNIELVAEGVELLKQVEFLREQHCSVFQGFYFSRPLSVQKVNGFMQSEKINERIEKWNSLSLKSWR